jgi:hypothetical protein
MKNEETLMVKPINKEKLIELIKEDFKGVKFLKKNQEFTLHPGAVIGSNCEVDDDCCYYLAEKGFFNKKVQPIFSFNVGIKTTIKKGSYTLQGNAFIYYVPEELIKYILDKEVSLKEFMGSRYNYNPRIIKNMREFINDIGSQLK